MVLPWRRGGRVGNRQVFVLEAPVNPGASFYLVAFPSMAAARPGGRERVSTFPSGDGQVGKRAQAHLAV
jgi:hypothetical protein